MYETLKSAQVLTSDDRTDLVRSAKLHRFAALFPNRKEEDTDNYGN